MDYVDYNQKWKEALGEAEETARFLGYERVTPGCILLGLLRVEGTVAENVLKNRGVTREKALEVISQLEGFYHSRNTSQKEIPYTPSAFEVVELAKRSGEEMRHSYRGPEHLVCGLGKSKDGLVVKIKDGLVVKMLGLVGINGLDLEKEIHSLLCPGEKRAAA